MKFDDVYRLLHDYQARTNSHYLVLREETLRQIYQCILATEARDCLELGTAWGATSCVMAAAVEELGGGMVTTIDRLARPIGVTQLAEATGLSRYVNPVLLKQGYNWYLYRALRAQTNENVCVPCYDFCFLDGAHFWETDALAALLVTRLLRPGGWFMLDDLHWRARGAHPGWETDYAELSDEEKDTPQVGMVFDLLVKSHPELSNFVLAYDGHIGWTRKLGGPPAVWTPHGAIAGAVTGSWSTSIDGATATRGMYGGAGLSVEERGRTARLTAFGDDPNMQLLIPNEARRPIDYVTLRMRLVSPHIDFVQLYWLGADAAFFDEACSMRCLVRTLPVSQALTFPISGTDRERTLKAVRLDPATGPCELLLESVTFLGR